MLKEGYENDPLCLCVFINKYEINFVIISIYVDDLNITETHEELPKVVEYLKKEFEMKDLRKTKFCLSLQFKHLNDRIFIH